MAAFHQTIIIGNVGRDPEVRYMASGDAACNLSVAVTESWKNKSTGDKQEKTTWYRVSMFGKLAEIAGQYLKKGSQVQIVGKMDERKWQDKDGVDKTTWELRADQMTMLGSAGGGGQPSGQTDHGRDKSNGYDPKEKPKPKPSFDDLGDDIPF